MGGWVVYRYHSCVSDSQLAPQQLTGRLILPPCSVHQHLQPCPGQPAITKSVLVDGKPVNGVPFVQTGTSFSYQITVTATGATDAMEVIDTLPTGITIAGVAIISGAYQRVQMRQQAH
jgi:hypothetical protein